jgi:hypothetical protein
VVESGLIFCKWLAKAGLKPVRIPFVTEGLGLNLQDFTSSQQEELPGMVLEVSDIPDSGDGQGGGSIQGKAAPIPGKLKGVQDIVENTDGNEGLV